MNGKKKLNQISVPMVTVCSACGGAVWEGGIVVTPVWAKAEVAKEGPGTSLKILGQGVPQELPFDVVCMDCVSAGRIGVDVDWPERVEHTRGRGRKALDIILDEEGK